MPRFDVDPARSRSFGLPDAAFSVELVGLHGELSLGAYLRASGPPGGPLGVEVVPMARRGLDALVAALVVSDTSASVGAPSAVHFAGAVREAVVGVVGEGYARAARLAIGVDPCAAAPSGLVVVLTWGLGQHGVAPTAAGFEQRPELAAVLRSFALATPSAAGAIDAVAWSRAHYAESATIATVLGAALGLLGLGGLAYAVVAASDTTEAAQVSGGGLGLLLLGVALVLYARRLRARIAPIFALLRDDPASIVWIYARVRPRAPPTARRLVCVGTAARRTEILSVVGAEAADEVLRALGAHAPTASRGFSPERQQQFFRDPTSLRGAGPG